MKELYVASQRKHGSRGARGTVVMAWHTWSADATETWYAIHWLSFVTTKTLWFLDSS